MPDPDSVLQNPEHLEFVGRVSHSRGQPILFLPEQQNCPRPFGLIEAKIPDGSTWVFSLVTVACNVAYPKGTTDNRLAELLRSWFGPNAGLPGTGFTVRFRNSADGWRVQPEQAQ